MPRAQRFTYADRVNYYLVANDLDSFNLDDLVEDIVAEMVAHGEVVTRCTRGCIRAYLKSLRIHKLLSRHPLDRELVKLSKKFKKAIDRIRKTDFVEVDYSNMAQISSLLRAAASRLKSLTTGELRERVIELLDELEALQAVHNDLKKKYEELQVDRDMALEERDELQKEVHDLKADKARLEEHNAELLAASTTRNATPARESSSANFEGFHTAPSSPQPGQQQPAGGTLSRLPTEIFSPVTPPRASISRNPSGLPTPPTTDARRLARQVSRSNSHSSSHSRRSFRENTPGAASVCGATPGSPSCRRHRPSPPLRQLSSQSTDAQSHASARRAPTRDPSYSEIRGPFRNIKQTMRRHFDVQYEQVHQMEERAVQTHVEQVRRRQALEEELAEVRGRLERLEETHRVQTQEYQNLVGRYNALLARMQELNGLFGTFTGKATVLLNMPTMVPGFGATAGGSA